MWKTLKSQNLFQAGFFKLRVDECEMPDGRVMPRYYVLEFPDWVNIVALTREQQVILVRQYRHGAAQEFVEIPGGSTHPGVGEEPQLAGERELLEETGYKAGEWIGCGFHYPNPALQANRMHTFLALDCVKVSAPSLDPFEDLSVLTMSLPEAVKFWRGGGFKHSLIASSFALALPHLQERGLL